MSPISKLVSNLPNELLFLPPMEETSTTTHLVERAKKWLAPSFDEATRNEVQRLINGPKNQLEDAFYKDLEFGTGGIRGVMGTGTNRINKYTLGKATQGLSNYLNKAFRGEKIKVAIAHDCRNNSKEFARLTAEVFSANNIEAYLFSDLRPTPELSFAIRHLGCHSGVVITASHNPPKYNGYKVYWSDGAQIVSPHDKNIIHEVEAIEGPTEIRFSADESKIHYIDKEVDRAFLKASIGQSFPTPGREALKIVFTSLHGTAITLVPDLLGQAGYTNLHLVEEQSVPDGNFPTVESPNPEERGALEMALKLAEETTADLVIGTDPDGDRLGLAVRDMDGEMVLLNGNQCGALLTDYLLRKRKENDRSTNNEFIGYTIVSSDIFKDIAHEHGVEAQVCLTGFKHIAKLIRDEEGKKEFVGGGEESYGYMVGSFVRDKDAVTSTLLACDMAAEAKANGSSLYEELLHLFEKHGLYEERLVSLTKEGKTGAEEIAQMMERFRNNPPSMLAGEKITVINDIQAGTSNNIQTGKAENIGLPTSNVLQFFTESGSKICARPSGTEPKIKFYVSIHAPFQGRENYRAQLSEVNRKIDHMIKDLGV